MQVIFVQQRNVLTDIEVRFDHESFIYMSKVLGIPFDQTSRVWSFDFECMPYWHSSMCISECATDAWWYCFRRTVPLDD